MFGKIKYVLKKNLNMKTSYVVGLTVFSLFIVVGGISVALYTSQMESRGNLNIVTGNLYSLLEGEELEKGNIIQIGENETKEVQLVLKNVNLMSAKFNLYYRNIDGIKVENYGKIVPPDEEGYVLNQDEEKVFNLKITNSTNSVQQIEFGSQVGLANQTLSFPSGMKVIPDINVNDNPDTLFNVLKNETKGVDTNVDFGSKTIDAGIYTKHETVNDKYPVYYYRGEVSNHLIFGGFCWKIVRTTDTGGVKIIYNGIPTENKCVNYSSNSVISHSTFNAKGRSPAYASYMYGDVYETQEINNQSAQYGNDVEWDGEKYILKNTYQGSDYHQIAHGHHYTCFSDEISCKTVSYVHYISSTTTYYITLENGIKIDEALDSMFDPKVNSTIKTEIDTWYQNHMTGSTEKLEDTIWCNDKSIDTYPTNSDNGWTKDGDATKYMNYGSVSRNNIDDKSIRPWLGCIRRQDSFTVNSFNGNGALTYPVGLLTADEATLAGSGWYSYSSLSYLYTGTFWWLGTPLWYATNGSSEFYIMSHGPLYPISVDFPPEAHLIGVRPAVSLKAGTLKIGGSGTTDDPYLVE